MKKIVRLTESDLTRLITRVIVEMETPPSISVNKNGNLVIDNQEWELIAKGFIKIHIYSLTKKDEEYEMKWEYPGPIYGEQKSIIDKKTIDKIMSEKSRATEIEFKTKEGTQVKLVKK